MQTEFQSEMQQPPLPPISGCEDSYAVHEAYMSGLRAGLSFQSLLTYSAFDPAVVGHLFNINAAVSVEAPPFNFFPEVESFPSHHYQLLPELLSLELPPHYTGGADSSLPLNHGAETMSYVISKQMPRKRRSDQKLSQKTRCLQKLLPWNKQKMDMATILEEAYKYIKFLQAQTSVLQSMPTCVSAADTFNESGGDLERLNRQQLLQVVVNSPMAQAQLYTKGCCIYAMEQLVLLKKNAERKALFHQMMLDANPNSIMFP